MQHDPGVTLLSNDPPSYSPSSINIHQRTEQLRAGLVLAGFGGSCNAYRGADVFWKGYPYTDEQLGDGLQSTLDKVDAEQQLILLTHVGPNSSRM
jgi:hypothetical protein